MPSALRGRMLTMMRRWLSAVTATSLFLLFPFAIGYLPYDHWDHAWGSVNLVLALGLICVTLCAALICAHSAHSLLCQWLLGTAVLSLVAARLGAPVLGAATQVVSSVFSAQGAMASAITLAAVLLPAILASGRTANAPMAGRSSMLLWRQPALANGPIPLAPAYAPLRI